MRLMAAKPSSPRCCRAARMSGTTDGANCSIDRVGVPDRIHHAFAGVDAHQLARRRQQRHLGLQRRIVAQAFQHDRGHLVAQAVEAAEPVEHAFAPEERVGIGGQFVPMRAEPQPRVGAMIGEIARDDAVLQHAAERQRDAAGRPGQPSGSDEIRATQHQRAERQRRGAAGDAAERPRFEKGRAPPPPRPAARRRRRTWRCGSRRRKPRARSARRAPIGAACRRRTREDAARRLRAPRRYR